MLTLILIGTFFAALIGIALKVVLSKTAFAGTGKTITGIELTVGTLIVAAVVMPLVAGIGFKTARANAVTFNEYWSGVEKAATVETTTCTKDGPCVHEYDCDPYTVMVTKTRTVPDGYTTRTTTVNGKTTTTQVPKYKTETYQVPETRWHSCPYVDAEYTYRVKDSMGETYTMGNHWFPSNPSQHRWTGWGHHDARFGTSLPNVETGQPKPWVAAKKRIDSGEPGGTTAVHQYKNYVLASQTDIYDKFSDAIGEYKKAGLLPKPVTDTYDYYRADHAYFVGKPVTSTKDWQDSVARFNGNFGSQRQGDLHLIIVNANKVTDPDRYTNAVQAYWGSKPLGRDALSKNGLVAVVGTTDGKTVAWARGFAGMPTGNETLSVAIRENLDNTPLTPTDLLGQPQNKSIDGALGTLVFASGDQGFTRVEMKDFEYLFAQIQPSGGQKMFMFVVGMLLALGVWALFIAVDLRLTGSRGAGGSGGAVTGNRIRNRSRLSRFPSERPFGRRSTLDL